LQDTTPTSETTLQRFLQRVSYYFSIHDAIKILLKLPVFETAFSGVWKVFDQFLVLPAINASFREIFFGTKAGESLLA